MAVGTNSKVRSKSGTVSQKIKFVRTSITGTTVKSGTNVLKAYPAESGYCFPLFPLPRRLATGTESQTHGPPSWVAQDLTHPQQPSSRLRAPLWPSPESTG